MRFVRLHSSPKYLWIISITYMIIMDHLYDHQDHLENFFCQIFCHQNNILYIHIEIPKTQSNLITTENGHLILEDSPNNSMGHIQSPIQSVCSEKLICHT